MPIDITMPRLSDTMERGTIIKWNVKEGDEVSSGDAIADIETDKATMEMQVYDDGKIAKLLVGEGKTVDVGTKIAVLAESGEDVDAGSKESAESSDSEAKAKAKANAKAEPEAKSAKREEEGEEEAGKPSKKSEREQASKPRAAVTEREEESGTEDEAAPEEDEEAREEQGGQRMRVSPVARRLAEEHDIDVASIQGSGPHGRVIKRDILKAMEAGQETAAAVPPSARSSELATPVREKRAEPRKEAGLATFREKSIELSNMRQIIAKRLVESVTTIPHYQVSLVFDVDALLRLRSELNEQLEPHDIKLSVNDFFIRACALAIHEHPEFNSSWGETTIEVHGEVNIGMAIALPAERGGGLLVGTIRHADQKSLRQISAEAKYLAHKARTRGLSPEEMQGSTFTISNLGMFGVEHFTAIINPPNAAILALGGAIEKPVVRSGQIVVGNELTATLSLDHRIIDGAMAAAYLQTLKRYVESPATLLV
jgi:pyruvate dehydrogenase E2 component (dihydrolipoamide acetyltransferase)